MLQSSEDPYELLMAVRARSGTTGLALAERYSKALMVGYCARAFVCCCSDCS